MSLSSRPKIFVVSEFYLPGYQSGALRTLANLVERVGDRYEFHILTNNFDADGRQTPYENIVTGKWLNVGHAKVYYLPKQEVGVRLIQNLIREVEPNIIYLNSFFYVVGIKTLLARKFFGTKKIPVIITPKGELSAGALGIKSRKKHFYIQLAKIFGLFQKTIFKTSTEAEKREVLDVFPSAKVLTAADLPAKPKDIRQKLEQKNYSTPGVVKMAFLSRIDRKKNLLYGLERLAETRVNVSLDIFGPVFDEGYWRECQSKINSLADNVQVIYKGVIEHKEIQDYLLNYDYFLFPTLSENYGHVLVEAMLSGLTLIISNNTPWRDLQAGGIGWDLPLEEPHKWLKVFEAAAKISPGDRRVMALNSHRKALEIVENQESVFQNINVLETVLKL